MSYYDDFSEDYYDGTEDFDDYAFEEDDDEVVSKKGAISVEDSYVYSMNNKGCVELDYMSTLTCLDKRDLVNALSGRCIWPDPEEYSRSGDYLGCFKSSGELLTGNLIKKYKKAIEINAGSDLFRDTIALYEKNLPEMIEGKDIHVSLGSTWIPTKYVELFIRHLLGMVYTPKVAYSSYFGKWEIQNAYGVNFVLNNYEYGTKRMSAISIIQHILNARPVKVYDQVPRTDGKQGTSSVLNHNETLAASAKEQLIIARWNEFIYGDPGILKDLEEKYMDYYGYTLTKYDGSFLTLPGLAPGIVPYNHQRDAIARIILSFNVLLAHEVGAGKTLEFSCGVHEIIRLGFGHKALIVTPNATLAQTVNAYLECYPQDKDKILVVNPKKEFSPANRAETLDKMKSPKYQIVFMAYSSFDMLKLSLVYRIETKNKEIDNLKAMRKNAKGYHEYHAYDKKISKIKAEIDKLQEDYTYRIEDCFDEFDFDVLVVDEIQNYKNITLPNKQDNIVGVHSQGSAKADNLLQKVEYIQSKSGRVIFATGTPITNSMADIYVLQRYLQPAELKMCNIFHFNEWVSSFCSRGCSFEIDVDSQSYRFVTRFSKFHNLPELMAMVSGFCDFYQIKEEDVDRPDFAGYTNVLVKKSEAQKEYMDFLSERTDAVRHRAVKRNEDNLLKITVDGRKCALDLRLVKPDAVMGQAENKVQVCAGNIASIYHNHLGTTQVVFCDISTPKDTFNVYDALKDELVKLGIKKDEIAYIHDATTDAKRSKLEAKFNKGEIRVLMGSTSKLGTGTNVQERLIAVHHLDAPWRPSDMVQREGRINRQGNTNAQTFVYRYVTEHSFDSYLWQILHSKVVFVQQFLSGTLSGIHREESDCSEVVLSYAEIKALAVGDPLIRKRIEKANALEQAKINRVHRRRELLDIRELLAEIPDRIKRRQELIDKCAEDIAFFADNKDTFGTLSKEDKEKFGKSLLTELEENINNTSEHIYKTYKGFGVYMPALMSDKNPHVLIRRPGSNTYIVKMDDARPLGVTRRLDNALLGLNKTLDEYKNIYKDLLRQRKEAQDKLATGNEYDAQVDSLCKELSDIDDELEKRGGKNDE